MDNSENWNSIFSSLWDKWSGPVYKFCLYKLNGDSTRAEDCMQNTFFTLYEAHDRITDLEHIHSWLFRVANNFVLKEFRRMKRETEQVPLEDAENNPSIFYEINPDSSLSEAEIEKLKSNLMQKLSKEELRLLNLTFEQNLPIKDIAEKLGVTESAVYKRRGVLTAKIRILAANLFE